MIAAMGTPAPRTGDPAIEAAGVTKRFRGSAPARSTRSTT